jgi:hypothetical protein
MCARSRTGMVGGCAGQPSHRRFGTCHGFHAVAAFRAPKHRVPCRSGLRGEGMVLLSMRGATASAAGRCAEAWLDCSASSHDVGARRLPGPQRSPRHGVTSSDPIVVAEATTTGVGVPAGFLVAGNRSRRVLPEAGQLQLVVPSAPRCLAGKLDLLLEIQIPA